MRAWPWLLLALAGCFDFAKFRLPDGGAPMDLADDAAPDLAAPLADLAAPLADLTAPDLAGFCALPPGTNMLVADNTAFDLGPGNWALNGNTATEAVVPGCVNSALRLCGLPVDANDSFLLSWSTNQFAPNLSATGSFWIYEGGQSGTNLTVTFYSGTGAILSRSSSVSYGGPGWEQLMARAPAPSPDAGTPTKLSIDLNGYTPASRGCLLVDQAFLGQP
jgi:hypothetical protein